MLCVYVKFAHWLIILASVNCSKLLMRLNLDTILVMFCTCWPKPDDFGQNIVILVKLSIFDLISSLSETKLHLKNTIKEEKILASFWLVKTTRYPRLVKLPLWGQHWGNVRPHFKIPTTEFFSVGILSPYIPSLGLIG